MKKLLATSNDGVLTLMRLVAGVVFFLHGSQKMLWFGGFGFWDDACFYWDDAHTRAIRVTGYLRGVLRRAGLIVGLLTRIAAFGIAVNMIVAVLLVHMGNGPFMNWYGNQKGEGYEYHLLALALLIPIIIRGAGAFSVDGALAAQGN
jgi:putative oxidoreductase